MTWRILLLALALLLHGRPAIADSPASGFNVNGVVLNASEAWVAAKYGQPDEQEVRATGYGYRLRYLNRTDIWTYPETRIALWEGKVIWVEGDSLRDGDLVICKQGDDIGEASKTAKSILGTPSTINRDSSFEPDEVVIEWVIGDTFVQIIAVNDAVVQCILARKK